MCDAGRLQVISGRLIAVLEALVHWVPFLATCLMSWFDPFFGVIHVIAGYACCAALRAEYGRRTVAIQSAVTYAAGWSCKGSRWSVLLSIDGKK